MVERTAAGVLLAVLALLAPAPALGAADPSRIWDAYPLPAQSGKSAAATPGAATQPPADEIATTPSDDFERLALASFLALIAGGFTTWFVSLRWPQARLAPVGPAAAEPEPEPEPTPAGATAPDPEPEPEPAPVGRAAPVPVPETAPVPAATRELWVHALPPVAVEEPEPEHEPPPPALPEGPSATPAPPDRERAWAAEIGWHLVDGGAKFRVVARPVEGGDPVTLGESPALEWPPVEARSVQALTDAVKTLESALVTAGWTLLPRGSAWYAKRFTWQPGARPRPAPVERTRHRDLYEREFRRQVDRTERMRETISTRLIEQGGQVAATAPE
jgi:hypothetical protein